MSWWEFFANMGCAWYSGLSNEDGKIKNCLMLDMYVTKQKNVKGENGLRATGTWWFYTLDHFSDLKIKC